MKDLIFDLRKKKKPPVHSFFPTLISHCAFFRNSKEAQLKAVFIEEDSLIRCLCMDTYFLQKRQISFLTLSLSAVIASVAGHKLAAPSDVVPPSYSSY